MLLRGLEKLKGAFSHEQEIQVPKIIQDEKKEIRIEKPSFLAGDAGFAVLGRPFVFLFHFVSLPGKKHQRIGGTKSFQGGNIIIVNGK